MPWYRFKKTETIVNYFPQLVKGNKWWFGTKDPQTGSIFLVGADVPDELRQLVANERDVAEESFTKPEEQPKIIRGEQ
jgi:hypothetical protein